MNGKCLNQNCINGANTKRPLVETQRGKCGYCHEPLDVYVARNAPKVPLNAHIGKTFDSARIWIIGAVN